MINELVKCPITLIIRVLCDGANKNKFKDANFSVSHIDGHTIHHTMDYFLRRDKLFA